MTELLNEIELALADLLQSGLDTGALAALPRLHALAARCEDVGLHTGAVLLSEVEKGLSARAHAMEKDDQPLAAAICRAVRYLELCREKGREEAILGRWEKEAQGGDGDTPRHDQGLGG